MTFTPRQYMQIAEGYDKAASDELVATEKREKFAKKAEWFHFLARREGINLGAEDQSKPPERIRRTLAPFLTTLWVAGAGVYLFSTLLFTNAINLFDTEDQQQQVAESHQKLDAPHEAVNKLAGQTNRQPEPIVEESPTPLPNIESSDGGIRPNEQGGPQVTDAAEGPHAISPAQAPYESPALTVPSPSLAEEQLNSSGKVLTVTATAVVRNGPSENAKRIGTATPGAELRVKARENDWVQFVDPSSGNSGWIQASLLATNGRDAQEEFSLPAVATPVEDRAKPTRLPVKPKVVKKPALKVQPPAQLTQGPRAYVQLPADDDFTPLKRRGMGSLNKRRMLREGLMSPDFQPPQ